MAQCMNLSFLNTFKLKPINHESFLNAEEYRKSASYSHQNVLSNILKHILYSQEIVRQSLSNENKYFRVKSKIWILKSPVGSGKTSIVLSALSKCRDLLTEHEILLNTFSLQSLHIYEQNTKIVYDTDLIIVPHTLYHQWIQELKEFPSLQPHTIPVGYKSVARHLGKQNLSQKIILIKDTMISEFLSTSNTPFLKFRSIYIDEPHSIKLKVQDLYKLKSKFYVLVCATPDILVYKMERLLSHFFSYQSLKLRQMCIRSITIEINDNFVLNSIHLEPYDYEKIICTPNSNINEIIKYIPSNIAFGLLGHDSNVFKTLQNTNFFQNEESVIFSVLELYNKKINHCIAKEAYIKANLSYNTEKKQELLNILAKKKEDLLQKSQNIDRIVNEMSKSDCVICFESMHENKAVLPCSHLFCLSCVSNFKQSCCPLCREEFTFADIRTIEPQYKCKDIPLDSPKDKFITLLRIIRSVDSNDRIILMVRCQAIAKKIITFLEHEGFKNKISQLYGRSESIEKKKKDFKNGHLQILILSDLKFASGINLEMATHVILFSKVSDTYEKQIIGRAWRPGRKTKLKVKQLIYDEECESRYSSYL